MPEEQTFHFRDYLVQTVRDRQGILNVTQARKIKADSVGAEGLGDVLAKHFECMTHSECVGTVYSETAAKVFSSYLARRKESSIFKLVLTWRGVRSRGTMKSFNRWKAAPANEKVEKEKGTVIVSHPRIDNWYIRRPSISSFGSDPSMGESLAFDDSPRPVPKPSIYQRLYEEAFKKKVAPMRIEQVKDKPEQPQHTPNPTTIKESRSSSVIRKEKDLKSRNSGKDVGVSSENSEKQTIPPSNSFSALLSRKQQSKPANQRPTGPLLTPESELFEGITRALTQPPPNPIPLSPVPAALHRASSPAYRAVQSPDKQRKAVSPRPQTERNKRAVQGRTQATQQTKQSRSKSGMRDEKRKEGVTRSDVGPLAGLRRLVT